MIIIIYQGLKKGWDTLFKEETCNNLKYSMLLISSKSLCENIYVHQFLNIGNCL